MLYVLCTYIIGLALMSQDYIESLIQQTRMNAGLRAVSCTSSSTRTACIFDAEERILRGQYVVVDHATANLLLEEIEEPLHTAACGDLVEVALLAGEIVEAEIQHNCLTQQAAEWAAKADMQQDPEIPEILV